MTFINLAGKRLLASGIAPYWVLWAGLIPGSAGQKTSGQRQVKNIIMMIADGGGFNQTLAADYFQFGKTGKQVFEHFPLKCAMSTFSDGSYEPSKAWSDFNYVKLNPTDSAAAATAMACGIKTYNKAIGVDFKGNPVKNISEQAEDLGKATGVVTTVPFSHATPAGFVAHNKERDAYEEIAREMLSSSRTDVIMGAGNPCCDDNG
jgi:alkaline phosphatase